MGQHIFFDLAAWLLAIISGIIVYRWRLTDVVSNTVANVDGYYFLMIFSGSLIGAYFLGTLNLYISEIPSLGRSIVGGLFGAILFVELYKKRIGINYSTGVIFIIPIAVAIMIGRLGCFFAGLEDQTFGIQTLLPIGYDFGDGLYRHPVQLYESASMLFFIIVMLLLLRKKNQFAFQNGFYLCIGWYSFQRFLWEFLKPYTVIIGPFNLFHFICVILMIYSLFMIKKGKNVRT